jgi:hypothetical protein
LELAKVVFIGNYSKLPLGIFIQSMATLVPLTWISFMLDVKPAIECIKKKYKVQRVKQIVLYEEKSSSQKIVYYIKISSSVLVHKFASYCILQANGSTMHSSSI